MLVSKLGDLPAAKEVAVIINVNTKVVATLALLSAMRYAGVPALVVDCESQDGSSAWFSGLMQLHHFHLMSQPLRQHGQALDWLFRHVPSERVLLVDSDLEMLNGNMIAEMRAMMDSSERVYGSGYLHPGSWLETHYGTDWPLAEGIAAYEPRPWIPFTLLRVSAIRDALAAGFSFMHRLASREFPGMPLLSRLLYKRFRFAVFRRHRFHSGRKPAYVFYDTGAEIHEHLTARRGFEFRSVAAGAVPWSANHLGGVTRGVLDNSAYRAREFDDAEEFARRKLKEDYGVTISNPSQVE